MASVFTELCIDCADTRAMAEFWSQVLGWTIAEEGDDDEIELRNPDAPFPTLLFVKVPEPKSVKNRLHIDVSPRGADQDAEVRRIEALGATRVDIGQGDVTWVVMADIEGNEFCVLRSQV